jgi:hypothetical protein
LKKQHIISEIIRTAKENNGIPLGRAGFERETGIKYTDWYGKFWTKWGDALTEAGYRPRQLQSAYPIESLITQIIALMRELDKFPTTGEIRMRSFNIIGFPSHNTIRSRLGNKSEMVKKILEYCEDNPEYTDIIQMCRKVQGDLKNESNISSDEAHIELGFVYLMKSGRHYKIGRSDTVEKRAYEIGIKLPEELKIIHKIKTDDPSGIEAYWHNRFEGKRKRGEWFDLSPNDVKAFKTRKFM